MKCMKRIKEYSRFFVYLSIFLFSLIVIIYRRQDAIFNPQFFAEDGTFWFAQAHNLGLKALVIPVAGYFQTNSRLIALFSTFFSYQYGPLLFNVYAAILQSLPILLLLSNRYRHLHLRYKLFSIFIYLTLFNTAETYLNVTNAQWYLALSMCLVIFSKNKKISNGLFDLWLVLLAGLSGPFSILMSATIICFKKNLYFEKKEKLVFLTAAVQLFSLVVLTNGARSNFLAEVDVVKVYDVWWKQVLWGLVAGPVGYQWLLEKLQLSQGFLRIISLSGLTVYVLAVLKARIEIKKAMFFSALLFIVSVLVPTVQADSEKTALEILADAAGLRYWLLPMLGVYTSFLWGCGQKNILIRSISCFYLGILLFFVVKIDRHSHNFTYPAFRDYQYRDYITKFEQLTVGESIIIPINPEGWTMRLEKVDK